MSKQKGVTSALLVVGFVILLVGVSMAVSFFTGGGRQSAGLFGWQDIPLLSGIENFFTVVYNSMVVISSWVTIAVLMIIFLGVQGAFLFAYYKLAKFVFSFQPAIKRLIDQISGI